jgi:hypothetical protein
MTGRATEEALRVIAADLRVQHPGLEFVLTRPGEAKAGGEAQRDAGVASSAANADETRAESVRSADSSFTAHREARRA